MNEDGTPIVQPEPPVQPQPVLPAPRKNPSPFIAILITALIVALIAGGGTYLYERNQSTTAQNNLQTQINTLTAEMAATSATATPSPTPSPSSSTSPSATATASTSYTNQYLTLTIPAGWTATQVPGDATSVNVTSGNYILYINTSASQASGVEGGRFAEIAQGSPSADAVIKTWPSDPCLPAALTAATNGNLYSNRADLYVDSSATGCNVPSGTTGAWYFSYLTNSTGQYFNDYTAGQNPGLVITMSYQTSSVNDLPKKGDATLATALADMTSVAASLVITGH